jgi:methylated-DNA-[protein]-cysteine S-methyltransferase
VDRQLHEYLRKERTQFDLPLAPTGSEFQNRVWSLLLKIPYGSTRTYGELAAELGHTGAARAVGRANATNPIAIIIPCHRVIGSSGSLTGYAGGLDMKEKLLQFEMGLTPSLFD